jgi:diguanylate cyclase (GGDEF)-like protein
MLSLLDAAPGALVLAATLEGELLYLNHEGRNLLYGDAITPTPLRLDGFFAAPTRRLLIDTIIPACLRNGSWRGETALVGRDGREIPVMQVFVANHIRQPHRDVTVLASIAWDLREQKAVEQALRRQATHDALTDCPNRALLMDRLTQATHRAKRQRSMLGVVFVDLDGFKQINDTFGHEQANTVLRQFSMRLHAQVRVEDTVARYGGDEFVLLIPDLGGVQDVERVTRKVNEVLQQPFVVAGARIRARASVGVAIYPLDGQDPETLVRAADAKMYRAKRHAKASGVENGFWSFLRRDTEAFGVDANPADTRPGYHAP